MGNFAAGIVLYNPDIERLRSNITAIYKQVKVVFCYNNNSKNTGDIKELIKEFENVVLIDKKENLGIATAINEIAEVANKKNITWLLTLDQDSICPPDIIRKFCKYIDDPKIGIICPLIIDKRRPKKEKPKEIVMVTDYCITSGSFMNLQIFRKLEGLDEYLFIGLVDDDYCYRILLNGYKIIQINNVILDHELGEILPSKYSKFFLRLGEAINSEKIKALSYKRKVSAMRVYYATRNIVYLANKYKEYPVYKFSVRYAIINGISNIIRSQNKIETLLAFFRGLFEGFKGNKEKNRYH